jgi:hypothetical protein
MKHPSQIAGLPFADYLKLPAIGQGVIQAVIERCPYAGWWESYLNPDREPDDSNESDIGTVAHSILLEGNEDCVAVIDPADYPTEKTGNIPDGWTNKAIRLARDNARMQGKTPILLPKMAEIRAMVASARGFIASLETTERAVYNAFLDGGGDSEFTLLWEESGILCRARPDRLSADRGLVVHVKTSQGSVEPDSWGRRYLVGQGFYITAAWYRRAIAQVFGIEESTHLFLNIEQEPPHLCSLVGVDPHGMELGANTVLQGLQTWQRCVGRKFWPKYPTRAVYPELPAWLDVVLSEREAGHLSLDERLMLGAQG